MMVGRIPTLIFDFVCLTKSCSKILFDIGGEGAGKGIKIPFFQTAKWFTLT